MPSRRLRQRLIQDEVREDDLEAKARAAGHAAAEEVADEAECIPGAYERGNLHFTEYAASRAADDFADERPDRHAEGVFFDAFVEALSDLERRIEELP